MILLSAIGILVTSILAILFHHSSILFALIIFFFGGCAFVIYPLSISHASDFLEENEILGAIGVITIAYGVGSVLGPIILSNFIAVVGPFGFFIVVGATSALLAIYTMYRLNHRQSVTDTVYLPAVTPESVGFSEAQEVVSDKLVE